MTILWVLSIPLVFGFLALVSPARKLVRLFFVLGAVVLGCGGWRLILQLGTSSRIFAWNENLMLDSFSALFVFVITSVGLLSSVYAAGYLFNETDPAIPTSKLRRYVFF